MLVRFLGLVAVCFMATPAPVTAQRVHEIRLVREGDGGYRFEPARINAKPGEILQFVVASGGPYVVGFEASDLSERDRALLDQSLPEHTGPLRGPVLSGAGARLRIVLPGLAKGSYRFLSVTQVSYRMGGVLVVR